MPCSKWCAHVCSQVCSALCIVMLIFMLHGQAHMSSCCHPVHAFASTCNHHLQYSSRSIESGKCSRFCPVCGKVDMRFKGSDQPNDTSLIQS